MLTVCLDESFDPKSPTLCGPYPVIGDCVSAAETFSAAMTEPLPIRNGDLGIWFMPHCLLGDQYACKWLLADKAGDLWLACKYFAVKYQPEFHKAVARVVAIVSGDPGSFDPELARRLADEIVHLRADPPKRSDVVVFPVDLLDQFDIIAAINGRHQQG